jgi:hypothetical protein
MTSPDLVTASSNHVATRALRETSVRVPSPLCLQIGDDHTDRRPSAKQIRLILWPGPCRYRYSEGFEYGYKRGIASVEENRSVGSR